MSNYSATQHKSQLIVINELFWNHS